MDYELNMRTLDDLFAAIYVTRADCAKHVMFQVFNHQTSSVYPLAIL